jgi:hypothetical protein
LDRIQIETFDWQSQDIKLDEVSWNCYPIIEPNVKDYEWTENEVCGWSSYTAIRGKIQISFLNLNSKGLKSWANIRYMHYAVHCNSIRTT